MRNDHSLRDLYVFLAMAVIYLLICYTACAQGEEYEGFTGHWVAVEATAYSPLDALTRDDRKNPRRLLSTGPSALAVPYGIAADPRSFAYGTRAIIPAGTGYLPSRKDRVFTFDDTGGSLRGRPNRIDLRYRTVYSATQFGRKQIRIFIIED